MKKKTAKIVKNIARPKLGKSEVEALVAELSKPDRIAREADRLIRSLRSDPRLKDLRFEPETLARSAAEHGADEKPVAKILDALGTPEMLERVRRTFDECAKSAGKLEEIIPFRVGVHILDAASEKERPPSQNPIWSGILSASAYDLPVALYTASRERKELLREAAEGRAGPAFKAFFEQDPRIAAVRKALSGIELEAVLIHAQLGFQEAHEIALPIDAALMGPIEAVKAARRRQTLAGIGQAAEPHAEQARILTLAVEKDAARAVPAYRREIVARLEEALGDVASPELGEAAKRRFAALFAMAATLELLAPARNVPLIAAYEAAAPRAIDEASAEEQALLKAILFKPLDVAPYRAYAKHLAGIDAARARAFADAALVVFPADAEIDATRKSLEGKA